MTNYTLIDNNLITDLKISDGAYRCYNLMLSMAYGNKIQIYPSIAYIATALGRSCRTVNRYIKELLKLNLISKKRRGSISSIYSLLQKKIQQTIEKVKETVNHAKKAVNNAKNYTKKESVWDRVPQRSYDFTELEKKLLE